MSVVTIPTNGKFTVKCEHCGFDTNKNPQQLLKGAELHLYFCGQCKENTLVRGGFGTSTIFKVLS